MLTFNISLATAQATHPVPEPKYRPANRVHKPSSDRYSNQVVALGSDDASLGEFTHLQRLADFLRRQQLDHAINLGRVGIGATGTAFSAQRRRLVHQHLHDGADALLQFLA